MIKYLRLAFERKHVVTKETLIWEHFHVSHNKALSSAQGRKEFNAAIVCKDLSAACEEVDVADVYTSYGDSTCFK